MIANNDFTGRPPKGPGLTVGKTSACASISWASAGLIFGDFEPVSIFTSNFDE